MLKSVILNEWVSNFHMALLAAQTELGWFHAANHLAQLGICCPEAGECVCIDDNIVIERSSQAIKDLHAEHKEYNTMIWAIIKHEGAFGKLRELALKDLVAGKGKTEIFDPAYAEQLLCFFLSPEPDPSWVSRRPRAFRVPNDIGNIHML